MSKKRVIVLDDSEEEKEDEGIMDVQPSIKIEDSSTSSSSSEEDTKKSTSTTKKQQQQKPVKVEKKPKKASEKQPQRQRKGTTPRGKKTVKREEKDEDEDDSAGEEDKKEKKPATGRRKKEPAGPSETDRGKTVYQLFYSDFANHLNTNSTALVKTLGNPVVMYTHLNGLVADIYGRFIRTYSERDLDLPGDSRLPSKLRLIKYALDCPDLYLIAGFCLFHHVARDEQDAMRLTENDAHYRALKKAAHHATTPTLDALRQLFAATDVAQLRQQLAVHASKRGDKKVESPTIDESLERLAKRLNELAQDSQIAYLARLLRIMNLRYEKDTEMTLSLERLIAENRGVRLYTSDALEVGKEHKVGGPTALEATNKRNWDLWELYYRLMTLDNNAWFVALIHRHLLVPAANTTTTATVDDLNELLYTATAPFYTSRESDRSFVFYMTRDLCFLLRELQRQHTNVAQYIALLHEVLFGAPSSSSSTTTSVSGAYPFDKAVDRQPVIDALERVMRDDLRYQALSSDNAVSPYTTPVYVLLARYERYRSPVMSAAYYGTGVVDVVVEGLAADLRQNEQTPGAAAYRKLTGDTLTFSPTLYTDDEIRDRVAQFTRLLATDTFLYHCVTDLLVPRFVDRLWGHLLTQLKRRLGLYAGRCCSSRDIRLLRDVLLGTNTSQRLDTLSNKRLKCVRYRMPWLTKRVFDAHFVEVTKRVPDCIFPVNYPLVMMATATGGGGDSDHEETLGYVRSVFEPLMKELQLQLCFLYDTALREHNDPLRYLSFTAGNELLQLPPETTQNAAYRCLNETLIDFLASSASSSGYAEQELYTVADRLKQMLVMCTVLEYRYEPDVAAPSVSSGLHKDAAYLYMKLCRTPDLVSSADASDTPMCVDMRLITTLENNGSLFRLRPLRQQQQQQLSIAFIQKTSLRWLVADLKHYITAATTERGGVPPDWKSVKTRITQAASAESESRDTATVLSEELCYTPAFTGYTLRVADPELATVGSLKNALRLRGAHEISLTGAAFVCCDTNRRGGAGAPQTDLTQLMLLLVLRSYDSETRRVTYTLLNDTIKEDNKLLTDYESGEAEQLFILAAPLVTESQTTVFPQSGRWFDDLERGTDATDLRRHDTVVIVERRTRSARASRETFARHSINLGGGGEYVSDPWTILFACGGDEYSPLGWRVVDFVTTRVSIAKHDTRSLVLIALESTDDAECWYSGAFTVAQYNSLCDALQDYRCFQSQRITETAAKVARAVNPKSAAVSEPVYISETKADEQREQQHETRATKGTLMRQKNDLIDVYVDAVRHVKKTKKGRGAQLTIGERKIVARDVNRAFFTIDEQGRPNADYADSWATAVKDELGAIITPLLDVFGTLPLKIIDGIVDGLVSKYGVDYLRSYTKTDHSDVDYTERFNYVVRSGDGETTVLDWTLRDLRRRAIESGAFGLDDEERYHEFRTDIEYFNRKKTKQSQSPVTLQDMVDKRDRDVFPSEEEYRALWEAYMQPRRFDVHRFREALQRFRGQQQLQQQQQSDEAEEDDNMSVQSYGSPVSLPNTTDTMPPANEEELSGLLMGNNGADGNQRATTLSSQNELVGYGDGRDPQFVDVDDTYYWMGFADQVGEDTDVVFRQDDDEFFSRCVTATVG